MRWANLWIKGPLINAMSPAAGHAKNQACIQRLKKLGCAPILTNVIQADMINVSVNDIRIAKMILCFMVASKQHSTSLSAIRLRSSSKVCNKPCFHISHDMSIVLNLTLSGASIALIPANMVVNSLKAGELIRVFPEWR